MDETDGGHREDTGVPDGDEGEIVALPDDSSREDPITAELGTSPEPSTLPLYPYPPIIGASAFGRGVFDAEETEQGDDPREVGSSPATPAAGIAPFGFPYPYANPGQSPPGGFAAGGGGPGDPGWPPAYGPSEEWSPPSRSRAVPQSRRARRGVAMLLVGALVAGAVGAGLGTLLAHQNSNGSTNALEPPGSSVPSGSSSLPSSALSTAAIAKLVSPAIVNIETTVATPAGQEQEQAAGTGMIVSSNGVILTNNHVVEDAQTINVAIAGHGTYPAMVLGTAKKNDVALLKVNLSGLPTVALGDSSSAAVGQPVVALGNALGLDGPPSTAPGYISGLGETITANGELSGDSEVLHGLLETNAQIQPGDSGGPLVGAKGQVIGMDTAAATGDTGTSLGFAIPINTARSIALTIEHHDASAKNGIVLGLSPYLGVWLQQPGTTAFFGYGSSATCVNSGGLSPSGGSGTSGASIEFVTASGPAQKAGMAEGDVITSIAGKATTSDTTLEDLVAGLRIGETVAVAYTECGTAHTTAVTIGGIPA